MKKYGTVCKNLRGVQTGFLGLNYETAIRETPIFLAAHKGKHRQVEYLLKYAIILGIFLFV